MRKRSPTGERPARLIGRALRLRCPLCGKGRMFRNWFKMNDNCSNCHFRFDRNERDYFIGAYTINLIVAELLVVGGFLLVLWRTWPNVPWDMLTWKLLAVAVVAPLVTYPFSKSIWLAVDLVFQPASATDYASSQPATLTDG